MHVYVCLSAARRARKTYKLDAAPKCFEEPNRCLRGRRRISWRFVLLTRVVDCRCDLIAGLKVLSDDCSDRSFERRHLPINSSLYII